MSARAGQAGPARPPGMKAAPAVSYGGQAVIEGVMMRGPDGYAVAVRRPGGEIVTRLVRRPGPASRHPLARVPFARGLFALVDSLVVGVESLMWSADEAAGEEEKLSRAESALVVVIGVLGAVGLFVLLPTVVAGPLLRSGAGDLVVNLAEGLLRLGVLIAYVWAIGRMPDVRRVYEYHGAEHKVINAYTATGDWSPAAAREQSTTHPRCGTSFLLFVVVVSVVFFSLFGWPNIWVRMATRLLLLPVVAGVAYEAIRLADRSRSPLVRWMAAPGLWLQRLTTREPDDGQLEVAAAALAALDPPRRDPERSPDLR